MKKSSQAIASLFVALVSGVLFGMGMMISGMVDPHRVIGFLDITGAWDPSLMFVMGGALAVFMPIYLLVIKKRAAPVCSERFQLSENRMIDKKLVGGAAMFGLGWGIAGICPGPAVTSISGLNPSMLVFIAAMLLGMVIANLAVNKYGKAKPEEVRVTARS
ncbi:YeeE/YedE family protein [Photobacterium alginatilyticum]|uniref:YeeE/YedE family protein n=1 Tax=Photobacterium alginatilyticum TaxID=1775171 RepID=A0ABW9YH55_9GAMM|nr:YeeE/YedE family protein [Photobacterium alginatilyticum]NBI53124.1 YeeE/YedE family protein [Photobacterium alginatilyticum]